MAEEINILEDLNPSQREAVEYLDGPLLVIAGAGSGKTRVLTYKIAWLLQRGMAPWNILALTFTNKAAREMKERIAGIVGEKNARHVYMGTFHSIFSRILRAEAEHIGYGSNYTIYDETDSRALVKAIVKELGLDEKVYKPSVVHSRISMAKNHLVTSDVYSHSPQAARDSHDRMPDVARIYCAYTERCRQANAMDFDDLLVNTWRLFKEHEDVRQKYAGQFQYVLVDEYQDTNYVQQCIVLQLTKERQQVCVVGDDYQSIYAFRGAEISNILEFKNIYTNPRLFKLERNYRSTQNIVAAANSLMKHNQHQIPKEVYSENQQGEKIHWKNTYSDLEEASYVCKEIKRMRMREDTAYSSFAILYRTNSQSRRFEDEMLKQNIPYRIYGGQSFYQRKEIKDVMAYFRLVANPQDEEAFMRVVNYPARGIGNTTLQKLSLCASGHGVSLWEVAGNADTYELNVNRGTAGKLSAFCALIASFRERLDSDTAAELGRHIIQQTGILAELYASKDAEDLARRDNVEELVNSLESFVDERHEEGNEHVLLSDYLQEVSLQTSMDSDDGNESDDRVSLMTVHSAKGLEFPTVFVVGMDENLFPSQLSTDSMLELEEERRLFYVAITRAEKHCILTSAQNRYRYGNAEFFAPSRFIKDIDPRFIDREDMTTLSSSLYGMRGSGKSSHSSSHMDAPWSQPSSSGRTSSFGHASSSAASSSVQSRVPERFRRVSQGSSLSMGSSTPVQTATLSTGTLSVGNVIEHQRFGLGTVTRIEGTGENTKATIEFRNSGTKQLLLKFAKYKVVAEQG